MHDLILSHSAHRRQTDAKSKKNAKDQSKKKEIEIEISGTRTDVF